MNQTSSIQPIRPSTRFLLPGLLLVISLLLGSVSAQEVYALVDIKGMSSGQIFALKQHRSISWWVEADRQLLVLTKTEPGGGFQSSWQFLPEIPVKPTQLYFIALDHFRELGGLDGWVLVRGGRHALVQMRSDPLKTSLIDSHGHRLQFQKFTPNKVLATQWRPRNILGKGGPDPAIETLVDQVDADRWHGDVGLLAGFNRYTHGSEISQARDWLVTQFQTITGLTVTTQDFQVGGTTVQNVIARIDGTENPDDWYIVGAHYDSTSQNPQSAAPGAEDNGSGSAGVLEMARVMVPAAPKSTLLFICFSGEEQGLNGSRAHVNSVVGAGEGDKIKAVLNMDMIGYTGDADLDCLLETGSIGSFMFDTFGNAAALYTDLRIVTSLNPFGSDHVPYLQNNIPALLTIENDWDSYPGYHRTTDQIGFVDRDMGGETLKMNVAALAEMAGIDPVTEAGLSDYVAAWGRPPTESVPDLDRNGRIDVLDLLTFLNGSTQS